MELRPLKLYNMKKILLLIAVAISISSCRQMLPTDYTLWSNKYGRIFSYYGTDTLKVGQYITVDGERMEIIAKH